MEINTHTNVCETIPNHFSEVWKLNEEIGLSGGSVEFDLFRKSVELHMILRIM